VGNTSKDSWKLQEEFLGDLNLGAALMTVGGVLVVAALIMPAHFRAGLFLLFWVTGLAIFIMGHGLRRIGTMKKEAFEAEHRARSSYAENRASRERRQSGERRLADSRLVGHQLVDRRSGIDRRQLNARRVEDTV